MKLQCSAWLKLFWILSLAVFLQSATLAQGAELKTPPASKASSWGYGTQYTLEGILTVHEEAITLNTADGRSFILLMGGKQAAAFHDKTVCVQGLAHQADDLKCLKVQKINLAQPKPTEALQPFKQQQTPPTMISASLNRYQMKNVRWGLDTRLPGEKHLYRFEQATILPDRVKEVYFIKKPFPPEWIAAHCLLLFTFGPDGMTNSKGETSHGLVLTIEAYQRLDQKFDLAKGIKKIFGVSWILATWQDYLEQSCKNAKEKLVLYRLNLTDAQKQQLVREALRFAAINRAGEFYHTITNNCTNNLILLINRVLDPKRRISLWTIPSFIYNFKATMPVLVPNMLVKKGLAQPALPEVNHETWQSYQSVGQ